MTQLRFEDYEILAADLGGENPLPQIRDNPDWYVKTGDGVSRKDRQYFGWGNVRNVLPYLMQDNYDRNKKMRSFKAAILENDCLKAVFLPEIGGKLWSLYDKRRKRELIYKNSVFQPANLALRNAWTSGGVEWNIGMVGHTPFTCSQLFTSHGVNQKGEPVLSMYEYERRRGLSYGINAYLPTDSEVLYVKVIVENTSDEPAVMYWWSNIAFPETQGTRVVVPTEYSFTHEYEKDGTWVDRVRIPFHHGKDITYPRSEKRAKDYFFDIPEEEDKWICAVDGEGRGLLHVSTSRLISRKMFLWGTSQGGENWNRFLSVPGEHYIEVQAGVAHTQYEHIPMPSNTVWEWTEGYTAADISADRVHSTDWSTAQDSVRELVARRFGENLENSLTDTFPAILAERTVVYNGTGWGALENIIRQKQNKAPVSRIYDYTVSSLGSLQEEWIRLMESGDFSHPDSTKAPKSYMISPYIRDLLEKMQPTYYTMLHLGIIYLSQGERQRALDAWQASLDLTPNAWAARNIAMMYFNILDDNKKASEYILKAVSLAKDEMISLIRDAGRVLTASGYDSQYLEIVSKLSEGVKNDGRVALYTAHAHWHLGNWHEAAAIINEDFVLPDNREGETATSDAWFEIYRHIAAEKGITDADEADRLYPLPAKLDFRMDQEN